MANPERIATAIALLLLMLALAACGVRAPVDSAPPSGSAVPRLPPDPTPRPEVRSRYGNGPVYEVHGKRYEVMPSSHGYQARGVASWYGRKFHGRPTASREPYDMYAMTAAHKSLPLPTYVEVRNLRNNRRVVVRVNDRGPFVDNRIIDLSYSAAVKLDMVRDGTSMVEVTAISFDGPQGFDGPQATTAREPVPGAKVVTPRAAPAEGREPLIYVQVGAFGDRSNAARRYRLLKDNGIDTAFVHEDGAAAPSLYRVRIGPIADVDHYDRVVDELSRIGIADTHLVTD